MIASEAEHQIALAAGRALLSQVEAAWAEHLLLASGRARSTMRAQGGVSMVLQALLTDDSDHVAIMRGVGVALGSWIAQRQPKHRVMLMDALGGGLTDGGESAETDFSPTGRA